MASSTRSRKTRKSRANTHIPGAARIRPRMQHNLSSPNVQTNTDVVSNTTGNSSINNLITPQIPSIATQTSQTTTVVSPESFTPSELKRIDNDNDINQMSNIASELKEPSFALTSLNAIKEQPSDTINQFSITDNENSKVKGISSTKMSKPSLETEANESTPHLQESTWVENKCHDVNNNIYYNNANRSDDKRESVNLSPENKTNNTIMTESVSEMPVANKRVMTATKAHRNKLHLVHTTKQQEQQKQRLQERHHNTSDASHQTADIDSHTHVTSNSNNSEIDNESKKENKKEMEKSVEDVYANAQTIEIEIPPPPPPPPLQPLQSSVTSKMQQENNSNNEAVNVETSNVEQNENTSSNNSSNKTSNENVNVKGSVELCQGTSTTPMIHADITSVHSHVIDTHTSSINTSKDTSNVHLEADANNATNRHAKHNSVAAHVTDLHVKQSLQKHKQLHEKKQQSEKRMMRKRSNGNRMKRGNSNLTKDNITTVVAANSNHVNISHDKSVKESITMDEEPKQGTTSQVLANNDEEIVNIGQIQEQHNEVRQEQTKQSNTVAPANADTINTESNKMQNINGATETSIPQIEHEKTEHSNKRVKFKLTLLEDIHKQINPAESSSVSDVTHARATISKTNLLKRRKTFPQQTEVYNENNNSESRIVNAEEMKITESNNEEEQEKQKYTLLQSEKEEEHKVINVNMSNTTSLASQQSQHALEELQQEKKMHEKTTSEETDNLSTTTESVNVKEQIPILAHDTSSSIADNTSKSTTENIIAVNDNSAMTKPLLRTNRANMTKVITRRKGKYGKSNEIHTAASSHNKENNNIISSSSNNSENNHIASENDDNNEGKNVENPTTQLQSVKDSQHLHSQKQEEPPHKGIDASIHATISEEHVRNKIDTNVQMEGKDNKNGAKESTKSENNNSNIHNDKMANETVLPMNETSAATKESVETNANSLSQESHRLRFFVELDEPSTTSQAAKAATVIITPNEEVVQIDNEQNVECMNESATHNGADCVNQKTASQVQGTGHKMHKIIDRKRLQGTTVVAEQQVKKPNESVKPIKRVGAVMMKAQAGKLRQRITAQSIPSTSTSTSTTASYKAESSQKHLSSIEEQQHHGKELEQKQYIVANHANGKVNTDNNSTANDTNDKTELPEEQSKLQKEEILLKQSETHSSPIEEIDVPSQPSVTTSTTLPPDATKESMPHEDSNEINSKSKNNSKVSIKRDVRTKRRLAKREKLQKQKQEEENLPSPQSGVKEETTTKLHQTPSHLHHQHSSPMGYIAAHPDITDVTVINRIRKRQEMERKLRKARRAWLQQKISNDSDNDSDNNKIHATNKDKVINIKKEMNIEISNNNNNNTVDSSNKFANHKSEVKGEMELSESNANHTIFSESNKHRHEDNEQVELYSSKASAIQQQDTISEEESNIDESETNRSMFDKVNKNMAFTKQHADNVATKKIESNTESQAVHTHPGQEHTPQQMPTSKLAEYSQPHTARVMQKFNVKKAKHQHPSPALQETHDNTHKSSKDDVVTNTNINLDCSASELKDEVGNKKVTTTQELINSAENNNNGMESFTHTERKTQEKQEGKEKLSLSKEPLQEQQQQQHEMSVESDIQEETPRDEKTDGIADNVERVNVDNTKYSIKEELNAIALSDAAHITGKESALTKITRPRKKTKRQLVHSPSRSNKHKRKNRNKRKTVIGNQKQEQSVEITQEPNMEITIKENVLNKDNQTSNTDKNNEEMENDTLLQERERNNNNNENVKVELVTHQTLSLSSHEQPLEEQIGNANNTSESAMNEENISETNNNDETIAVDEESREQELELFSAEQQEEQQEIMENVSMETHDQQVEAHEEEEEQEEENVEIQEVLKQEYTNRELKQAEEQQLSSPIHKKRFFTELEPSSTPLPELDRQENVKSEYLRNFVSNTNNVTDNTIPLEQGMNAANDQQQQRRKSQHQLSTKAKSKTHHINNKIINSEFTSVDSDDVNTTTNAISTNDATHSHIKSKNEVESTDESQCDMLTQNKHVAQSFETNANNEHLNDNENTVENVDEESILGVRSNRKEEMTSKHSGKENDKSDSKKDATYAKETELCVEPNVQTDLPSSPHVESLHKPEVQATVPFALRHFPKKIMKMMKLNKKRVSVFTAPVSNNNDYVKHTDADEEDTIQKNMANDDTTKTDNSVHEEQCTNNVVKQNQMDTHVVNATLAELEGTVNVASQIEQSANAQSLRSCQEEEEWKELEEQELEVEKQQQQRELKYEQKKEQKKLTEVDNREESDPILITENNYITTDNIVANTEVSLTPQVLRRLSAKRKIKKHAELAAARRKSIANMTSSITSTANTKLNNGNEQEQQIEEKQDLFVKDAEMPNKVDAVNNNTQLETENANIQCTQQQQQQQQNNEASNNDNAKFLHHKRKSNLKELDALSQIDHLIHYAEESTPTTNHAKTINTPTGDNNYAGVIDHNSDGSNIIKPALHTSEEMLLNKYALSLPSGNVLLEEFSEKEMLLRRNSLEVPWEVGLRFD